MSRYFTKGRMAVIDGRLQLRDWIDRNGNKRRSAEILANSVHFHAQAGRQVCRQLRRGTREAVFNSDGTNEHVWNIDKGQPLSPTVGQI